MRISWIVVVALLLAPAVARADGATDAWLGTWSGKLKGKGCSKLHRKVALDVAIASDGVVRSNGDALSEGLGDLDWQVGKKKLDASREGLTATLTRTSKKKARLSLRTDGGCRITATLTRTKQATAAASTATATATAPTTGLPECDAYGAQIMRAAACPAMAAARDTYLQAYQQFAQAFQGMDPAGKAAAAQACKAAADGLNQALTASGC